MEREPRRTEIRIGIIWSLQSVFGISKWLFVLFSLVSFSWEAAAFESFLWVDGSWTLIGSGSEWLAGWMGFSSDRDRSLAFLVDGIPVEPTEKVAGAGSIARHPFCGAWSLFIDLGGKKDFVKSS